jgi:mannose-6-phosphate isomerase-like protein (cupin superfamily)
MRYAMHESEAADGRLFDADRGCELFSQRTATLSGAIEAQGSDEVLYVLDGRGTALIDRQAYELAPGTALFVARGTPWELDGEVRAVSVLVHDAEPSRVSHAVVDLDAVETGTATAGRQFLLGVTPEQGCASVTQFIGLVPPGRAPDHFHTYDEVIYVLDGEGTLFIGSEEAELRPGSCVHLPARLVHCLANTGETELRLLGVFRPAGSPAEAYYPDGTLAVLPTEET